MDVLIQDQRGAVRPPHLVKLAQGQLQRIASRGGSLHQGQLQPTGILIGAAGDVKILRDARESYQRLCLNPLPVTAEQSRFQPADLALGGKAETSVAGRAVIAETGAVHNRLHRHSRPVVAGEVFLVGASCQIQHSNECQTGRSQISDHLP